MNEYNTISSKAIDKDIPGSLCLVKKADSDIYELHSKVRVYTGTLRRVWQIMCFDFGVSSEEVRFALKEMESQDHLAAHFGTFGSFLFTQPVFPVK